MTGVDTNVLVQLALKNHSGNGASLTAVQVELEGGNALVVTTAVLAEFLHVITDSRRFTDAMSMVEVMDWVEEFLGNASGVQVIPAHEASARQALVWMRQFQLGRKRILDTNLAAALYVAGCRRILSSNPGDFTLFKVFEVIRP